MSKLNLSFLTDWEKNRIHIHREFNAPQEKVWKAWTTKELLDKWWPPQPYRCQTKIMDLHNDSLWFYSFLDPNSWHYWYRVKFKEIVAPRKLSFIHCFCSENIERYHYLPTTLWEQQFSQTCGITTAAITIHFDNNLDIKHYLYRDFEKNVHSIFENLDKLLATKLVGV